MKYDQEFKPKFWVFHDTTKDFVYMATFSKSLHETMDLAREIFRKEYEEYQAGLGSHAFDLIEFRIVRRGLVNEQD